MALYIDVTAASAFCSKAKAHGLASKHLTEKLTLCGHICDPNFIKGIGLEAFSYRTL